ncbi:MAG: efflux RND transporter periplasmic adaptor subunit [Steroidobacteraceae bacterium]
MSTVESGSAADGKIAPRRAMILPMVIMIVAVVLILGGVFAWKYHKGMEKYGQMMAAASIPQTVSTIAAADDKWQSQLQATGSLRAVRGADLSSQASGIVDEIHFDSGNDVPAGKVLLRLRPLDDYALLQQLQAAAELAEQNYKRDQEQFAAQAISQAVIDGDQATLKTARAQVEAQHALIQEKIVAAPFAGRLGIRQVDLGQYLAAGTAIVTLQALDPILIDFYLPQQALSQLKIGKAVRAQVDTYPGRTFNGVIEAINSKVDVASRNVQVRASFHNADRLLVPGMYATVSIDAGDEIAQITLPQAAITYNPYGNTVFVVEQAAADDKGKSRSIVKQRFVRLGATRGDQVAVLSGIKAGEIVVTGGQMKLRNGSAITINNSLTPANEINPNPPNE